MRPLAPLAAAALLAAAAPALAQPYGGPDRGSPFRSLDRADREALFEARLAAIPVGLRLTPEQRGRWQPVEQSLRAVHTERLNRWEERRRRDEASLRGGADPSAGPASPSQTPPGAQGQPAPQGQGTAGGPTPQAPASPPATGQATPAQPPAAQAEPRPQRTERWLEDMEERSQRLAQSAERVRAFSAAMRPFWASLDERQRRLFGILMQAPRGIGPGGTGLPGIGLPGMGPGDMDDEAGPGFSRFDREDRGGYGRGRDYGDRDRDGGFRDDRRGSRGYEGGERWSEGRGDRYAPYAGGGWRRWDDNDSGHEPDDRDDGPRRF